MTKFFATKSTEKRDLVKAARLALMYGMSPHAVSADTGLTLGEVNEIAKKWEKEIQSKQQTNRQKIDHIFPGIIRINLAR